MSQPVESLPLSELTPARQAIMEAAAETFAANGYRSTSMDEIAVAAGVARRSLYHHFASKKEILLAACLQQAKDFLIEVRRCVPQQENFPDYMVDCLTYVIEQAPKSKLFMLDVTQGADVDPVAFYFANDALIDDWIEFFHDPYLEALRRQQINPAIKLEKLVNWFGRLATSFLQYQLAGESAEDIRESIEVFFVNGLKHKTRAP